MEPTQNAKQNEKNLSKRIQGFINYLMIWCSLYKVIAGFSYLALATPLEGGWVSDKAFYPGFTTQGSTYIAFGALAVTFSLLSVFISTILVSFIEYQQCDLEKEIIIVAVGRWHLTQIILAIASIVCFVFAASIATFSQFPNNDRTIFNIFYGYIPLLVLGIFSYVTYNIRRNIRKYSKEHGTHSDTIVSRSNRIGVEDAKETRSCPILTKVGKM